MKFKEERVREEFWKTPPMLQVMALWFEQLCLAHFGVEPTVTRIFGKVAGDSGIHATGRAIDFRDEHGGKRTFTDEQVRFLVSEMNRRFPGNDRFPSLLHHSFQGAPLHFHLQLSSGDRADPSLDCFSVI